MNKQLRVHQQNFKDASYQNSNYSLVYDNPDKNVRSDLDKSIKTKVVTFDTSPGSIIDFEELSLKVVGTTLTSAGTGYHGSVPNVTISGGGGSGAAITASIGSGVVSALTITNAGSGYTSVPSLTIAAPPSADQATATAQHNSSTFITQSYSVTNDGAGYVSAPSVSISAPNAVTATATASTYYNTVSGISLTNVGSGYSSTPIVSIDPPSYYMGTQATAIAVPKGDGTIKTITVTNAGSYYTSTPNVSIAAPTKTQATATAVLDGDVVDTLNITNAGAGYVSTPTVTIAAQTRSTATATALMGLVGAIDVTHGGHSHTTAPTVTISGGGGSSAAIQLSLLNDAVASGAITAGTGYTSVPTFSVAPPTETRFKEDLIEPLIIDRLSDVFLDSFTTFNCKANTSSDTSAFILNVEEFNIHSNSNNSKLAFNKCIIPNMINSAVGTFIHKSKKLNYICSINPCRLHTLTLDVSVLDGTTIKEADGSRFIAEFVIKPQAIKL